MNVMKIDERSWIAVFFLAYFSHSNSQLAQSVRPKKSPRNYKAAKRRANGLRSKPKPLRSVWPRPGAQKRSVGQRNTNKLNFKHL